MARVTIRWNEQNFQALIDGPIKRDLDRRARRVRRVARALVPRATGELERSIDYEIFGRRGNWVARVGSDLDYALFVNSGTGVHGPLGRPIVPRNGQLMVWEVPGQARDARARQVEGQPARQFLELALEAFDNA